MAKTHNYVKDGIVACRRIKGIFGENWEVVEETKTSYEDLVKREEENAAAARKVEHKRQHIGVDSSRKQAEKPQANSGNSPKQRPKASKGK